MKPSKYSLASIIIAAALGILFVVTGLWLLYLDQPPAVNVPAPEEGETR